MRKRSTLGTCHQFRLRRKRTVVAAGLAGVVVALASGCGGGSSNSSATTSATATSSSTTPSGLSAASRALFTYAACMRGKGVDIPDPVRGANGRYAFPQIPANVLSAAGVRAKAQACSAKLPQGTFRRGGQQTPTAQAAFQKFSKCMSANGAPIGRPGGQRGQSIVPGQAPPNGQGQPQGQGPGGGLFNSTDPKAQAALAKCRKLLPAGAAQGGAP